MRLLLAQDASLPLPAWFLEWLSVDPEALSGGTARLRFARFPEGELGLLTVLGIILAIGVVFYTYYREGRLVTWKRLGLASLRSVLLLVLALIVFYPVLEVDRQNDLRAVSIALIDDSLSQSMKDRYLGAPEHKAKLAESLKVPPEDLEKHSRSELLRKSFETNRFQVFHDLRKNNLLEVHTYSDQLRLLTSSAEIAADEGDAPTSPAGDSEEALPEEGFEDMKFPPRGSVTDLAGALRAAVERQGGTRVAGMVVYGDGRVTAGESLDATTTFLRDRGIPVYAVGLGDPSQARNLRVTALLNNERVFKGDPVAVDVRLLQQGYDDESVTVELTAEKLTEDGNVESSRRIGAEEVDFAEGRKEASTSFRVDVEELGDYRLTAKIEVRQDETFSDDNQRSSKLEVVDEASKVLLIAGGPSYEYRFLKNLLRRDRRIHLAAWLMSADINYPQEGDVSLNRLPDDQETLFEYDVVLLIDPDPAALPTGLVGLLQKFVADHRGGLVYIASETHSLSFFREEALRPVWEMLPVVVNASQSETLLTSEDFHTREWPLIPTIAATSHPPTRLSSRRERNLQRWTEVGGFYWSFPFQKLKPAATPLFRYSNPMRAVAGQQQPVVAWQYFSGGRTLFIGSDESWRWRSASEEIYDQFWIQSIRFLTEPRLSGGRREVLQTEAETYELGEAIRVSALILDESYNPVDSEFRESTITPPEGEPIDLRLEADPQSKGWFRGTFVPRALGEYQIKLTEETSLTVRVDPPDLEFQDTRLDEATLRTLAEGTGGQYFPIWEAGSVGTLIPDRRQVLVTADEPIPLWDNWFSLCLLAGLLTAEWILRKLGRLL